MTKNLFDCVNHKQLHKTKFSGKQPQNKKDFPDIGCRRKHFARIQTPNANISLRQIVDSGTVRLCLIPRHSPTAPSPLYV